MTPAPKTLDSAISTLELAQQALSQLGQGLGASLISVDGRVIEARWCSHDLPEVPLPLVRERTRIDDARVSPLVADHPLTSAGVTSLLALPLMLRDGVGATLWVGREGGAFDAWAEREAEKTARAVEQLLGEGPANEGVEPPPEVAPSLPVATARKRSATSGRYLAVPRRDSSDALPVVADQPPPPSEPRPARRSSSSSNLPPVASPPVPGRYIIVPASRSRSSASSQELPAVPSETPTHEFAVPALPSGRSTSSQELPAVPSETPTHEFAVPALSSRRSTSSQELPVVATQPPTHELAVPEASPSPPRPRASAPVVAGAASSSMAGEPPAANQNRPVEASAAAAPGRQGRRPVVLLVAVVALLATGVAATFALRPRTGDAEAPAVTGAPGEAEAPAEKPAAPGNAEPQAEHPVAREAVAPAEAAPVAAQPAVERPAPEKPAPAQDSEWAESPVLTRGRVKMGEIIAPSAGTLSWSVAAEQRVRPQQLVGHLAGARASRSLKSPAVGLTMRKHADGEVVKRGAVLGEILYFEAWARAEVTGVVPTTKWRCEIASASAQQHAPCKVSVVSRQGVVTVAVEPRWFDGAADAVLRLAPP